MLLAMVAGLIGVMIITGTYMRENQVKITEYTPGGEEVSVPLKPLQRFIFKDNTRGRQVRVYNYKGISVQESDTARMVTLHTTTDWLPYIKWTCDSANLIVNVNFNVVRGKYLNDKQRLSLRLRSKNASIATVIMPRGMLREVVATNKTVYLDSINADEIISLVEDRLVLNNSHINTLNSRARKINELKLDNSTVGNAQLKNVDKNFRVTCTSDASVIDKMYIDNVSDNPHKAYFKFEKANIRDFKFNTDKKVLLNVEMKSGNGKF